MKKLFTLISTLALALTLRAQPAIHGQVLLQNSRIKTGTLQPVAGAGISADSGGSDISDQDGKYSLAFTGIRDMTHARVQAHKHGFVVVNERDLQAAIIGAEAPLNIYMADSAALAQEQAQLYEINLKVLTAEKDKLIQRLRSDSATSKATLAELKERFNQEFEHRWAAENFLNEQLEDAKERLPEYVAELARVNLDFASERYRRAYAFFREGKMDLALRLLDSLDIDSKRAEEQLKSLDDDGQGYSEAKEAIDLSARQVVDCYRLKAEAYSIVLCYNRSVECLVKALNLQTHACRGKNDMKVVLILNDLACSRLSSNQFKQANRDFERALSIGEGLVGEHDERIASIHSNLASLCLTTAQYRDAIFHLRIALRIVESEGLVGQKYLLTIQNRLGIVFREIGTLDSALNHVKKAVFFAENSIPQDQFEHAKTLISLSEIYYELGDLFLAQETIKRATDILDSIESSDHEILLAYNSRSLIERAIGDYVEALEYSKLGIDMLQASPTIDSLFFADFLDNRGLICSDIGDPKLGLYYCKKALEIRQKILGYSHPKIATSINNLGINFLAFGKVDSAKWAFGAAIKMLEGSENLEDLKIVECWANLGMAFLESGEFATAIKTLKKAIAVVDDVEYGVNNEGACAAENSLAMAFSQMGRIGRAISHQSKAIRILELETSPRNARMVMLHNNLSLLYLQKGKITDALSELRLAISISLSSPNSSVLGYASSISNLGTVLYYYGKVDSAFICKSTALQILRSKILPSHPNILLLEKDSLAISFLLESYNLLSAKTRQLYSQNQSVHTYSPTRAEWNIALGNSLLLQKDYSQAIKYFEKSYEFGLQSFPEALRGSAEAYARLGITSKAIRILQLLWSISGDSKANAKCSAICYSLSGDADLALESLNKAIRLGCRDLDWIKTEEAFDALRDHPRYIALIKSLEEKLK